jgi:hypothetical protein
MQEEASLLDATYEHETPRQAAARLREVHKRLQEIQELMIVRSKLAAPFEPVEAAAHETFWSSGKVEWNSDDRTVTVSLGSAVSADSVVLEASSETSRWEYLFSSASNL